ncbi:MAG: o-succinylbenzoate synthase [Phormidium sp.]
MYRLRLHPYERPFRQPLQTHHGPWTRRRGILLQLTDGQQRQGFGEIAPLPEFGSESLEAALDVCQRFQGCLTDTDILNLPDTYPACQFALESAREALVNPSDVPPPSAAYCHLLPSGEAALQQLETTPRDHWGPSPSFKWKIAIADLEQEQHWFGQLLSRLPAASRLRLDANAGLTWEEAQQWLAACDGHPIEYLEQPLPVKDREGLLALQQQGLVTIALDESVANLWDLQDWLKQGWPGIFIIKAAIIGSPRRLRQLCREFQPDLVFSSVFETAIGRQAALRLAAELQQKPRALGFGVGSWFNETDEAFVEHQLARN